MKSEEKVIVQQVIMRPLADLVPNPKNPRTATEEEIAALAESIKANPDYFDARPIVLSNRTGVMMIIDGEQRSKAARLLGMVEVPTILMERLTEAQEDEIMVRGNTHSGKWDFAKLRKWDVRTLVSWNLPKKDFRDKGQKYDKDPFNYENINGLIYEPQSGSMPEIEDCIDCSEAKKIIASIEMTSGLTDKEREVLKACAWRFVRIDFAKMADYFCHASEKMQRSMESQWLVIVDYNKVHEKAFNVLVEDLRSAMSEEIYGEDE